MNKEQLNVAQEAMIEWLSQPQGLGKRPNKIEYAGEFDYHELHYYMFKYKRGIFGQWLVGVCGGFKEDDLIPCGHIFSSMKPYNEATANADCIAMVQRFYSVSIRKPEQNKSKEPSIYTREKATENSAKYVNTAIGAENSGNIHVSKEKFIYIREHFLKVPNYKRKLFNNQNYQRMDEYLRYGDTQPAIVHSINPLVISAYSDEMDAVLFLRFPDELAQTYDLEAGTRLVTSNVYFRDDRMVKDIIPGKYYMNHYSNFIPIVQLFLSDEEEYIWDRVSLFNEARWERVQMLTETRATFYSSLAMRNGFFYLEDYL